MGIVTVLVLSVPAGCSHGSHVSKGLPTTTAWNGIGTMLNANYMCHTYVPGQLVDAIARRSWRVPRVAHRTRGAAPARCPAVPRGAAAAWCWTLNRGVYSVYELAPDGTSVKIAGGMSAPFHDDQGAPVIP